MCARPGENKNEYEGDPRDEGLLLRHGKMPEPGSTRVLGRRPSFTARPLTGGVHGQGETPREGTGCRAEEVGVGAPQQATDRAERGLTAKG
jgi:hypothetical protein